MIFVSYASPDKAVADAVCAGLEAAGLRCWIAPRDVVPGEFYADAIVHAIDAAQLIVLVLSKDAAASPHVLREVERASSKRHPIVSLRTDLAPLPGSLEYFLNTSQWLDASSSGVERAMPQLVEAVQRMSVPAAAATTAQVDTQRATPRAGARRRPSALVVGLVAVIAAGLGYVAVDKLRSGNRPDAGTPAVALAPAAAPVPAVAAIPDNSVAVLPFTDMSEKKDQEYFSDGMAEEIIDLLARVPDLHVPARTSSFYFKGKSEDVPTIAKRLMVAHVLEGSVRTAGKNVRITAQLVRADTGYHLWSETYDRKLDDVFKVQDEIATAVVKALKVSLLKGSLASAAKPANAEAHALYLQGLYYTQRDTRHELNKAIAALEQAVRLAPTAAPYWAQLSRAYSNQFEDAALSWTTVHERALKAAEKALALDPRLPEAHIARAKVALYLELDFPLTIAEIDKARALDPMKVATLDWNGVGAMILGNLDEAVSLAEQAGARDPLSTNHYSQLGLTYLQAGRFADAAASARMALELNENSEGARATVGLAMLQGGGDRDAALAEIAKEPDLEARAFTLALGNQLIGRPAMAEQWLSAHEAAGRRTDAYEIAQLHAVRGEADLAFEWLEKSLVLHDGGLSAIKADPLLNPCVASRAMRRCCAS